MAEPNITLSGAPTRPSLNGKTVVVADDDKIIREYISLRLKHLGLRVETASDGLNAILKVSKERPDLLILDLGLPDVEGFRVVERLCDPKFVPVPVIILTGRSDDLSKQRCDELNVFYVHKDSGAWSNLEPLVFELLGRVVETPPQPEQSPVTPKVLLVDDNQRRLDIFSQSLRKYPVEVIQAIGGTEGFLVALKRRPALIVADYYMEQGSGSYLLSRIKSAPSTQHIPVIIYASKPVDDRNVHALQRDLCGRGQAASFIVNISDPTALLAEIHKRIAA